MKKYLVLIGAAILVAALASPALAQFKSYGHVEIAASFIKNQDFNVGGVAGYRDASGSSTLPTYPSGRGYANADLTNKNVFQRFRIFFEYGDAKTVRAVLGFEADSTDWGEALPNSTNYNGATTGTPSTTGTWASTNDNMGVGGGDAVQLGIRHAFLEFVIPNTPLTMTAGIQSFIYGTRFGNSQENPGLALTANFAPHKIKAMWYRRNDADRYTYQSNDAYILQYVLTQKQFNVDAWFHYQNDRYTGRATPYDDKPWWLGVRAGFRPGNFILDGQFVYKGGTRDNASTADVDYTAWAAYLDAKYQIGPGMIVGLEGFYATGADTNDATKTKVFAAPTGDESQANFGYDRTVFFWMNWSDFCGQHMKQYTMGGFWYARADFEYAPTPWLNLIFNYLYIGDTSKGSASGMNSGVGARTDLDKDKIGQEINVIAKLKIYQNLLAQFGVGYFMPGDVYDSASKTAENAWAASSHIIYSF